MDYVSIVTLLVTIASAITATTSTPKEGSPWLFVYQIIEAIALVNDKAKQK